MDPAAFQRLHPRTYLERFLAEGLRPDGREPSSWRNVSVNAGSITTANGSALARVGDTTVVCGVKAEITEPDIMTPNDGYIVHNLDLSAICSPKFKPGPPAEEAQVISQRITDLLISSKVLPLSSLCITPGKSAWVLYIDATCINYDGNAFDATLIAVLSALLNTQLPKATYYPATQRTTVSRKHSIPLSIDIERIPYSFSFGTFGSSNSSAPDQSSTPALLVDPTSFEEPLLQSHITISLFPKGQICSMTQTGGTNPDGGAVEVQAGGSQEVLMRCIDAATERLGQIRSIVESSSTRSL